MQSLIKINSELDQLVLILKKFIMIWFKLLLIKVINKKADGNYKRNAILSHNFLGVRIRNIII
jgi:hypothetical protein